MSGFILRTFLDACMAKTFHNKWMSAQTWAEIINHNFSIQPELQFDGKALVGAIKRSHLSESMDVPWTQIPIDHCGIFCHALQPKGKSKINYYYATSSGSAPSLEKAWTENISLGEEFLKNKVTRSNVLSITANIKEQQILPANKKRKTRDFVETSDAGRLLGGSSTAPEEPSAASSLGVVGCELYWVSTEAKKLFKPIKDEQDALEAINNQMELLLGVLDNAKGFWSVVSGWEGEDDISEHQKWMIVMKCQYLYCALYHARVMMPKVQNWDKCCQVAMESLLLCGVKVGRCSRTVHNWYLDFTRKNRSFDVRSPPKHRLPNE